MNTADKIKSEAEKIRDGFLPYCAGYPGEKHELFNATQIAIKHVEWIMEETDSLVTMDKYTKILNQLKQM